jgi:hypothetical protein
MNAFRDQLLGIRCEIRNEGIPCDPAVLAKRLKELKIRVPAAELIWFATNMLQGERFVPPAVAPQLLIDFLQTQLAGQSADLVVDPCAGFGLVVDTVREIVQARKAIAISVNSGEFDLGHVITPLLCWQLGNPLDVINTIDEPIDLIVSILPFNARSDRSVSLADTSGKIHEVRSDIGSMILAAYSLRLSEKGMGIFVIPPSLLFSRTSILNRLSQFGIGVETALELPAGAFSPYTNISTFAIVVRRRIFEEMFVAQLSPDPAINRRIVENSIARVKAGPLELGRLIQPTRFRGIEVMRLDDQIEHTTVAMGTSARPLADFAVEIRLGRRDAEFEFEHMPNSFFIPTIGNSNVVNSTEAMTLKRQNYAQVVVDPTRVEARFVAGFLNSSLGRTIREANKSGAVIRQLNLTGLRGLNVFVPSLSVQRGVLEMETRLVTEENTILGLQNEIAALRRELWNSPHQTGELSKRLANLSTQLASGATSFAASTLEQWFETLPFPMASILRAWQAARRDDYKTRYEHLLHFFEATAEFFSVIFLSAFESHQSNWPSHLNAITSAWHKQGSRIAQATFGTWKIAVEYFSKQTRLLLRGTPEQQTHCRELFCDDSLGLPSMLADTAIVSIISSAVTMRNDWHGHGGVVGEADARFRNEQLVSHLQQLRDVMKDGWEGVKLINSLGCRPYRDRTENDVELLVGSNSEFLKETRTMATALKLETLYLIAKECGRALPLLPLLQMRTSPQSAKNACYFFNRVEKDGGLRFVSYHFVDQPNREDRSVETSEVIRQLTALSASGPGTVSRA